MNEQEREKEATRVMGCIRQMDGYGASFLNCPLCPIDHLFDVLTLEAHIANQHLNCGSFKCTCKQVLFTFPHMQEHIKMHKAKGEEHECRLRLSNKDAFIRNTEIPKIIGIAIHNLMAKGVQKRPDKRTIGVQHRPQVSEKSTQKNVHRTKKKETGQQTDLVIKIPRLKKTSVGVCQTEPSCVQKATVSTSSATTQTKRRKQKTVETQTRMRSRCIKTQTTATETVNRTTSPIPYRIPKKREMTEPKKLLWNEGQQPASIGLRVPLPLSPTSLPSVGSTDATEMFKPGNPFHSEPYRPPPLEPINKRPRESSAPVPHAPSVTDQKSDNLKDGEPPQKVVKIFTTFLTKKTAEAKPLLVTEQTETASKSSTNGQQKESAQQTDPAEIGPKSDRTIDEETGQIPQNERIVMKIKKEPVADMPPPASPTPCPNPTDNPQANHPMEETAPNCPENKGLMDMDIKTSDAEDREKEDVTPNGAPEEDPKEPDLPGPSRFERGKTPHPTERMLSRLEAFNPTNSQRGPKRRRDSSPPRRPNRRTPSPRRRRRPSNSSSSSRSRSRSPARRTPSPETATSSRDETLSGGHNINASMPSDAEQRLQLEFEKAVRQLNEDIEKAKTETTPVVVPVLPPPVIYRPPSFTMFQPQVVIPYSWQFCARTYRRPPKYPSLPVVNQLVGSRSTNTTKEVLQMSKKVDPPTDPREIKRINVLANRFLTPKCPYDPEELARRCQWVKETSIENVPASSEPCLPRPGDLLIPPPPLRPT